MNKKVDKKTIKKGLLPYLFILLIIFYNNSFKKIVEKKK